MTTVTETRSDRADTREGPRGLHGHLFGVNVGRTSVAEAVGTFLLS